MECAYARDLRSVALASISLELRALNKRRRSPATSLWEQRSQGTNPLEMLQKRTDEDRKALRDHIAHCQRCQHAD
jgi:hypothetical protein